MNLKHVEIISTRLGINKKNVENTIKLLNEGSTIPFISRYRKEMTGSLDETQIMSIRDENSKLEDIEKRKVTILKTIKEQGKLNDDLKKQIEECYNSAELEDIYLPYKPKKKTKASVAREKGLEPLAKIIMKQKELNIKDKAAEFINDIVANVDEAIEGALHIIAEWINENKRARNAVREVFKTGSFVTSSVVKGKEEEGIKYKDYYNWSEPLQKCPSHRFLAIMRGEAEGFLKVSVMPDEEEALKVLEDIFIDGYYDVSQLVGLAVKDCYKRLLGPSIENEFRAVYKEKSDDEAIRVFAENLRQLLLAPPLGEKRVMAIDPGYRTGCKVVCLDKQGNLLHNETIFPHPPQSDTKMAAKKVTSLIEIHKIEAIAIGNGTASRETENFIRKLRFNRELNVFVVSESGASVYSASKIAREEFPQYDVTVRGAISIGRRLMDPLAELVKIDPKSIGVGQYQHDVDQNKLKTGLDQVVESCVNAVGVNLNIAGKHILTYISGLGAQLAQNIVDYRKENGTFKSREDLKKVPRMGSKAFEQSAGFLRIPDSENVLDNSAVHPESYTIVQQMAKDLGCHVSDLIKLPEKRKDIDLKKYISSSVGIPTLNDILKELEKPGRDPRSKVKIFEFSKDIFKMEDVKAGMILPGIVTNITNFGAFIDIGVKQDGLVHISQLANKFVSNPTDIVKLHQHVVVKVIEVDVSRKRIQLSMKDIDNE